MSIISLSNTQFQRFVDFASAQPDAAKSKTVATIDAGPAEPGAEPLADRTITATAGDSVGKMFRRQSAIDANNRVRDLFKEAVADIFGGEDKIPESVKKSMKLGDFGQGKPLTARRIMAVNVAIEKLSLDSFEMENAFESPEFGAEMKAQAELLKHVETDFPKLNRAANLLSKATGMPLRSALLEVMDKQSAAYSALQCGELYMKSVGAFKKGLELHEALNARGKQIEQGISDAVASGDEKKFAEIATLRAEQLKAVWKEAETAFALQNATGKSNEKYVEAKRAFDTAISNCKKAAKAISSGKLAGLDKIFASCVKDTAIAEAGSKLRDLGEGLYRASTQKGGVPQQQSASYALTAIASRITSENTAEIIAFRKTLAENEMPRITARFAEAETKSGFKMHKHFLQDAKTYIAMHDFGGIAALERFAEQYEANAASLHFSESQKKRLQDLVAKQTGSKNLSKTVERFISDVENCVLCNAYIKCSSKKPVDTAMIENLVKHFEAHPEIAGQFAIGVRQGCEKKFLDAVKKNLTQNFKICMDKPAGEITSLKTGMMPQAIREYNKGCVTFNGKDIPDATIGKTFFMADSLERRGYGEFLEDKFDDKHVQIRRMVSFVCGMADGLGGALNAMFTNADACDPKLLKSMPRNSDKISIDGLSTIVPGQRSSKENYDITIDAKTGDVTIKLTHYEDSRFTQYFDDKYQATVFTNAAKETAKMAEAKFVVTLKIKNATDAQLGDKMPSFEITGFTQEVL